MCVGGGRLRSDPMCVVDTRGSGGTTRSRNDALAASPPLFVCDAREK